MENIKLALYVHVKNFPSSPTLTRDLYNSILSLLSLQHEESVTLLQDNGLLSKQIFLSGDMVLTRTPKHFGSIIFNLSSQNNKTAQHWEFLDQ